MNLSRASNLAFAHRPRADGVADQAVQQGWQVEPAVEPVGEGAEVTAGVIGKLECLVAAADSRLQVAQDGVDPGELRHIAGLAIADDDERVDAARVDDTGRAAYAVAANVATGQQIGTSPVGDGLSGEARQRRELDAQAVAAVVGGHGCDDRHLGGIGTADGARVLAAEMRIVDLHAAGQWLRGLMRSHDGHHSVVDQPGGTVAGAQLPLERPGRQPGLVLADQVDRQEPGAQRQLGAFHDRAGGQRGLVTAGAALEQPTDGVVGRARATRAAKAVRPAQRPCKSNQESL